MKANLPRLLLAAILLATLNPQLSTVQAQTSAFTYQGRLGENGQPANGVYDFRFALFSTALIRDPYTDYQTNSAVQVTDGLFATVLDFGVQAFDRSAAWLEIGVRTNQGKPGQFSRQTPRQPITSSPWAIRAATAEKAVLASNVAPASITSAALAPGSVQTVHVQSGAIGGMQLATGAVGGTQLADFAVQGNHIGGQAVSSSHLAPGAVTSSRIAADTVNSSHLRQESVQNAHIAVRTIQGDRIAQGIIVSNHVAAGAIHRVHLAPDAVFTNASAQFGFVPPGGIISSASPTPPQTGYTLVGATDSGSGDAWVAGTTAGAPPGVFEPALVWTGSELLTWSGFPGTGGMSPYGGRYNPTTDTWQLINTNGSPRGRMNPVAVWNGTEMIVWGGGTNDGAIYKVSTDSWRPMTMANVPALMVRPIAVWTSSGMLVWGEERWGEPMTNYRVACCLYNPTANTWTRLSTNGSPTYRQYASHVWTGSELIIWGGTFNLQFGDYTATGARYRLSDNTWRTVSMIGAPSPRSDHSAVWTGSRMILWGGYGEFPGSTTRGRQANGASYNPATDTWSPISKIGAPEARNSHVAVWTGSKMIVWGGIYRTDVYFRSGGMYDPVSDTWLPTAVSGAPAGRYEAYAFWTAGGMLIYSGSAGGSSYPQEVQKYDPTKGLFYMYRWQ